MKKYLPLFVVALLVVSVSAFGARQAQLPITHGPLFVFQAYPGSSAVAATTGAPANVGFRGYLGLGVDPITAVPGVLSIDSGINWANFVGAASGPLPQVPANWFIKNVVLTKQTPVIGQCADVFPSIRVNQQGSANIRRWWPLMYEVPGTTFTLTVLYGTTTPYVDSPQNPIGAYVHTEVWTWQVDATLQSMMDELALFHELPFGLDEVPLVSDEVLYPKLQAKLASALAALNGLDLTGASLTLGDFEMEVMDACIGISPRSPVPTGGGTGIANTAENPACCKLLADTEYVAKKYHIWQTKK